ncbi:MAG TPA: DUF4167 domain-containing protein [Alphaproteobacteria bacterium]
MAFHRNNNNNGNNNRYNNRQNFRPRHNNNQQHQQGGQRRHVNRINHVFESAGPDGRVRGTAQQLVEKYSGLARDAHASGDTVLMLNCYQHAEHYQRLYNEIMEENGQVEREREAQRAQYQAQQPAMDGENGQPQQNQGQQQSGQPQPDQNDYDQADPQPQQRQPYARRQPSPTEQPAAAAPQQSDEPRGTTAAASTGGRVMGRRPGPHARDNQGTSQMRDEDMPSFLKKDIPIKATPAPAADAAAPDAAEPAAPAAFGRVRRAPVRKPVADSTDGADTE